MTEMPQGPEGNSPVLASNSFVTNINNAGKAPDRAVRFAAAQSVSDDDLKAVLTRLLNDWVPRSDVPDHVNDFIDAHGSKFNELFFKAIKRVAEGGAVLHLAISGVGPAASYEDKGTKVEVKVWGDPDPAV